MFLFFFFSFSFHFHRYTNSIEQYLRCRRTFFMAPEQWEVSKSLLFRDRKLGQKLLTAHCVNEKKLREDDTHRKNTKRSSSSVSFAFKSWCRSFTCSLTWNNRQFLPPDDNAYMHQLLFTLTDNFRASPSASIRCMSITNCAANHQLPPKPTQPDEQRVRLKKFSSKLIGVWVCLSVSYYHHLFYVGETRVRINSILNCLHLHLQSPWNEIIKQNTQSNQL